MGWRVETGKDIDVREVSFWDVENGLKLDCGDGSKILSTTELCKWMILWYVKYISIKLTKHMLTSKSLIPVSRLLFHHTSVLEINKCTTDTMTVSNKAFSVFCHTCSTQIIR